MTLNGRWASKNLGKYVTVMCGKTAYYGTLKGYTLEPHSYDIYVLFVEMGREKTIIYADSITSTYEKKGNQKWQNSSN